ncbi:SusC/RagA family TonB-linked outer membrane protein [Butyricimonas hominis]|uniref:SusC/RagA family TonB-linked outer membrane protein n=1 Tax=Butyricimonas TaxID=574697 RepID=UPI0035196CEF
MRLFVLFMCCFTLSLSAKSLAQQEKVNLSMKNVSVQKLFNEIQRQTNLYFLFNIEQISRLGKVSVEARGETVETVLTSVFKDSELTYVFDKNMIIVRLQNTKDDKKVKTVTIRGKVCDEKKQPLPGVTVMLKGFTLGTATTKEGTYLLQIPNAPEKFSLLFSFIGMESREIEYVGQDTINVIMKEDVKVVDEVVVTGYQTVNRKDMVGSYATVKMSDIMMPAYTSLDQMLQGRIAGMVVMNTSSRVGTNPNIRIRGTATLLGNKDPLWVVDGVIQPDPISMDVNTLMTDDLKNILGNQISWLNPNDIEMVTVLKDASATAIYGSKASNGVIVITTKKGKNDRLSINYNMNFSFRARPMYDDFNLMDSRERVHFSQEVFNAGAKYQESPLAQEYTYEGLMQMYMNRDISEDDLKTKVEKLESLNTNWLKLLTRNSFSHNHSLSMTGGNEKASYSASFGFSDNKGIEVGNNSKSLSGRIRLGVALHPKVYADLSIVGQLNKNMGYGPNVNPLGYATNTSRAIAAYDEDGNYSFYKKRDNYKYINGPLEFGYNILNELANSYSQSKNQSLNATLNFSWDVLSWLKYEFVGGVSSSANDSESYAGERTYYITKNYRGYDYGSVEPQSDRAKAAMLPFGGEYFTQHRNVLNYNIQNKLLFSKTFDDTHRVNVMLGAEVRSTENKSVSNTVWGYVPERGEKIMNPTPPNDIYFTAGNTPGKDLGIFQKLYNGAWGKTSQTDNYFSLFATIAYSWNDRYVFNMNVRNDVSNRFGQDVNKRVDPTYSFGVSWRVAEEEFIKSYVGWLDQLNIRASYGIQGNVVNSLSPELIATVRGVLPVYNQYYSMVYSLPNPHLKWERTKTWNLGLDVELFHAVTMTLEYYGRTSNAIIEQDIPQEYGKDQMSLNGGHITNEGVEYTINLTPFKGKNFAWTIGLNSSKNWNKAKKADIKQPYRGDYLDGRNNRILKEGYPLSAFWSYSFKGLNKETGYPEFNLMDQEGIYNVMDPADYLVYSGQKEPNFTGGLTTRVRYKGISFGASFSLLLGAKKRLSTPFKGNDGINIPDPYTNLDKELLKRWKKTGDEERTTIPAVYTGGEYVIKLPDTAKESMYEMWRQSDLRVVNASFLRCRQLSLSWNIDREWVKRFGLTNLSLSAVANNIFVICSKKFNGFDPELDDNSVMPRTYSFGINIGL